MRWSTKSREPAEDTKSFYWRNHGMVAVSINDPRMPWDLREMLKRYMTREYGVSRPAEEKR